MTKLSPIACGLLSLITLSGLNATLFAEPSDDQSTDSARVILREAVKSKELRAQTVGYYPTLRYYGKDYTVHYGFVSLTRQSIRHITEPDPLILPPDHPVVFEASRVVTEARKSTPSSGPTFRASKKLVPAAPEPAVAPAPAATEAPVPAAPAPNAAPAPAAAPTSNVPRQPALPVPAQTSIQPSAKKSK